jgi:hypothetical protein
MKRFVVAKLFEIVDRDDPLFRDIGEENVFDCDTWAEAESYIEKQKDPDTYIIRDTQKEFFEEDYDIDAYSQGFASGFGIPISIDIEDEDDEEVY